MHSTGKGPSHSERSRRLSVCGGGYSRYSPRSYYPPAYEPRSGGGGTSSGGGSSRSSRPSWSSSSSAVTYTPAEVRSPTPVRRTVEERARAYPDLRDVFLCHAWDDRRGATKELHDLLESNDVSVWLSEKDVMLGAPLLRAIDKGPSSGGGSARRASARGRRPGSSPTPRADRRVCRAGWWRACRHRLACI